jgi:hypothetical protein
MDRATWREFERIAKSFFEQELSKPLLEQIPLKLRTGEVHKFDLISDDEQIVIECKNHTWTKSGNYPSAKVIDAQRSIELLHKCPANRKIIVFHDHQGPKETLVAVFVRRNKPLLAGIEVWRYLNCSFEKYAAFPSKSDDEPSAIVRTVVEDIQDSFAANPSSTCLNISVLGLSQHLNLEARDIRIQAPEVCTEMNKIGMTTTFDGTQFFIRRGIPYS